MGFINKKRSGGFMDEIRCDESSYLIWKWHPAGSQAGSNNRENAIRWGSSLRVKDGEVAVFVYNQNNGVMQDYMEGPYDQIIETENFPVLASILGRAYDGGTPFQAEVYFINLAKIIQVKFGVPFFDVYDPRFLDFGVPTAVRGSISFKISDYRNFVKLHRLRNFSLDDFQMEIRDAVSRYVKSVVANAPTEYNIPLLQIERKIVEINEMVQSEIASRLAGDFGVEVSGVDISTIELDKESEGFKQLKVVTQDVATATIQAQTAVNIKEMQDKQSIESEDYEEKLQIQRDEAQYAQHKKTKSENFSAFQVESQVAVGVAGANVLGQMSANGIGDMSDGGVNPADMMAGMAIGGAIGQNIAGTMNTMMAGVNQPPQVGATPPPVPTVAYYVALNGQATGSYDLSVLKQMADAGQLLPNSLVWSAGMSEWAEADTIEALKPLFVIIPPFPFNIITQ